MNDEISKNPSAILLQQENRIEDGSSFTLDKCSDYLGSGQPTQLQIEDWQETVSSWKELLRKAVERLSETNLKRILFLRGKFFPEIKNRVGLKSTPNGLMAPLRVNNEIYVEGGLDATMTTRLLARLVAYCGIELSQVKIVYRTKDVENDSKSKKPAFANGTGTCTDNILDFIKNHPGCSKQDCIDAMASYGHDKDLVLRNLYTSSEITILTSGIYLKGAEIHSLPPPPAPVLTEAFPAEPITKLVAPAPDTVETRCDKALALYIWAHQGRDANEVVKAITALGYEKHEVWKRLYKLPTSEPYKNAIYLKSLPFGLDPQKQHYRDFANVCKPISVASEPPQPPPGPMLDPKCQSCDNALLRYVKAHPGTNGDLVVQYLVESGYDVNKVLRRLFRMPGITINDRKVFLEKTGKAGKVPDELPLWSVPKQIPRPPHQNPVVIITGSLDEEGGDSEKNDIDRQFVSECSRILSEAFPHGLHRDSILDRKKFCRKYEDSIGAPPTDECIARLWEVCAACGVVIGDKVFPLSEEAKQQVETMLSEILLTGARQGYFTTIFEKYQQDFCAYGIGSAEVLAGVVRKLHPEYEYGDKFFSIDASRSIEDEVVHILRDANLLTVDELQIRLPSIPREQIYQVCRTSEQIIKDGDNYILLENLRFDYREVEIATSKIQKSVMMHEYALLREVNFENSESLNCHVSREALLRGFFRKYLSPRYDLKRDIISAKHASLSVSNVLTTYCKEHAYFSLAEIESLAQELNGYANNQGIQIAQQIAVQVDDYNFVRKDQLDFDVNGIDKALSDIITDGLIPLQGVSTFISFPAVSGYSWTHQLLASYCRLVSKEFALLENSASNVCNGIIARQNLSIGSYYRAVAILALKNNVMKNVEAIGNYALRTGLLSRRRASALSAILTEMKDLTGEI